MCVCVVLHDNHTVLFCFFSQLNNNSKSRQKARGGLDAAAAAMREVDR